VKLFERETTTLALMCFLLSYQLQEDFPRTPSPVYQLSRSSSRAATEEGADAAPTLDMQLTHLRDASQTSATTAELNVAAAGLGSRTSTPIPGVASMHGQSSGPAAPVPRTASLDSPVPHTRSPSPGVAMMGAVPGLSGGTMNLTSAEARSVALNRAASASAAEFAAALQGSTASSGSVMDLAASLQGMSMSDVQGAAAAIEDRELLQQQQLRLQQQQQRQQQQQQQQQQQRVQIAAQAQAAQVAFCLLFAFVSSRCFV
jgi:pumilio RNA-binding family